MLERRNTMEIITFSATKGGVGKTTLTFNYGEWLSDKGYNVLLIDSDHQCSLTQTYDVYRDHGTIANIFTNDAKNVELIEIHNNLSLLPASMSLDIVNNDIQTKPNKELIMYMWLADHYEYYKQFDYVLIDCHPDFSTITQNMIAIADYVFSPVEPSEYGFTSKNNLELRLRQLKKEVIRVDTRESFVTAELKFLGNRIKHNKKSSREFIKAMKKDPRTLAFIPEKELFNKSTLDHTPLSTMKKDQETLSKHKHFFKEINQIFTTLRKS